MDLLTQLQTQNKNNPVEKAKHKGFVPQLEKQGYAYMTRKGNGNYQITNAYLLSDKVLETLGYTGKHPEKRTEKGDEVRIQIHKGYGDNLVQVLTDKKTGKINTEKVEQLKEQLKIHLQINK